LQGGALVAGARFPQRNGSAPGDIRAGRSTVVG